MIWQKLKNNKNEKEIAVMMDKIQKNVDNLSKNQIDMGIKYTPMTKCAMKICFMVHQNQVDKNGMPYIFHPVHLAEQMTTEDEICTALLHDVVEDSDYTIEDLKKAGFNDVILEALRLLTHDKNVPYMEYIAGLKDNPLAKTIKLADLKHNSDLNRLDKITEKDLKRVEKYKVAREILEASS